jgi:hypothetical protein
MPVITEISSTHGDKNFASSKQERCHSWHKINSTAWQKGQKLYKMTKKLKGALQNLGVRAYDMVEEKNCPSIFWSFCIVFDPFSMLWN